MHSSSHLQEPRSLSNAWFFPNPPNVRFTSVTADAVWMCTRSIQWLDSCSSTAATMNSKDWDLDSRWRENLHGSMTVFFPSKAFLAKERRRFFCFLFVNPERQ